MSEEINRDAAECEGAPTIGDSLAAMMGQPPEPQVGEHWTKALANEDPGPPLTGQPIDTAPAGNKMAIAKCAACDGHHENLDVHQYQTPQPPWTHWYLCPTLGDPCPVSLAAMNKGPGMELDGAVCQALAQAQAAGRWLVAVFWIDAEQMIRYSRTTMKFPTGDFPHVLKQLKADFERETGPSQPEQMAEAGPLEPLRSIYGNGNTPLS